MLAPVRTAAPADLPVSVDDVKLRLHIDGSEQDSVIIALIEAATAHLDGWSGILGRALVTQSWRQDFCGFAERLRLPLGPAVSITTVSYYDGGNAAQELDPEVFSLLTDARGPYVAVHPGRSWPSTFNRPDAVSVTYVAGSPPADVPEDIKTAIHLLVGSWFENREASVKAGQDELPFGVNHILAKYRRTGI